MKKKANIYKVSTFLSLILVFFLSVLYFQDSGEITGMVSSQVGNFSASVATFISCTWSNDALAISFGTSLDPNTNDINATGNYLLNMTGINGTNYNATLGTLSNVNANFTIQGEDLVSSGNSIGVGNITWTSNDTIANSTTMVPGNSIALTTSYDTANPVGANITIGNSIFYRFWLDVPGGTTAGAYAGNYTMQCVET